MRGLIVALLLAVPLVAQSASETCLPIVTLLVSRGSADFRGCADAKFG